MGRLEGIAQVITGHTQKVKESMSDMAKYGVKTVMDLHNAMKTEMELDVLDFVEDRRNDADSRIRKIDRLITLNVKYVDFTRNPRLAELVSNWRQAMQIWAAIMDEKKERYGDYYTVEFEELSALPDGQWVIRKLVQDFSPQVVAHLIFQYRGGSDWQREQVKRQGKGGVELKFTPVAEFQKKDKRLHAPSDYLSNVLGDELGEQLEDETQKDIYDRVEYIGNTEFIETAWIVYYWLHPEKFTFPNTPIVINTGPQPPQGGNWPQQRPDGMQLQEAAQKFNQKAKQ